MLIAFAITIGFVVIATVCDLRSREIPDWISLLMIVCATLLVAFGESPLSYWGMIYGMLLGLLASYPFFHIGGIGGGDVKLVAAIGSLLGPFVLLTALFWVAISGGILAVLAKFRGEGDFAYVPAILSGVIIAMIQLGGAV